MNRWPFYLVATILFCLFLTSSIWGVFAESNSARLSFLFVGMIVFLIPHIDGVMGSIEVFKATFKKGEGGIEIRRKVAQADHAAERTLTVLAKAFPVDTSRSQPTIVDRPTGEPWREMIRVSDLLVRKLADRMGEDPDLLSDLPLPTAIALAARRGILSRRQADALNAFYETRQILIELCLRLRGDTPVSVTEKAWRLKTAGEQIAGVL